MAKITISLDTKGFAVPGVDFSLLENNISAEIDAYSEKVGAEHTKTKHLPPAGAQGEGTTEWIINLLQDPDMAKVYARVFIHALNRLLTAISEKRKDVNKDDVENSTAKESKIDKAEIEKEDNKKSGEWLVKVKAFNKTILLPTSIEIIKDFLETIGAE